MKKNGLKDIVIVHDPGNELFPGILHPGSALFADYLDMRETNREHSRFRRLLRRCGLKVYTVRQMLLEGTVDLLGNALPGKDLDQLRQFASQFLIYDTDGTVDTDQEIAYKQQVLAKAHPEDLVKIILNRPRITLRLTEDNTGYAADYTMRPMMNLMYMRDQMIVTRKGVVIGRLNSPQRIGEGLVAKFCVRKFGIEPLLHIQQEDVFLEGGDYILSGDISFIGCGMRTTWPAIDSLLTNQVFGTGKVVVVKDSLFWQSQMHLDTYFNMIAPDLAVLSDNRYRATADQAEHLTADIYELSEHGYTLSADNVPFTRLLEETAIKIIPLSMDDSLAFGANFLTVSDRDIIAVKGSTGAYRQALRDRRIRIHQIDLTHSTKGYGAAHCMSQIIPAEFVKYEHLDQEC